MHIRPTLFIAGPLAAILIVGALATVKLTELGRDATNEGYIRAAASAAAGLNTADIASLTGTTKDLDSPAYRRILTHLETLRESNPDCRFAYLMGLHEDKVVFLADGEPPDSPDASPPGEPYTEATPVLFEAFESGKSFIEGPITDRWGTWVTGHAPIRNAATGKIIAMMGIDWDAGYWRRQVNVYRWFGIMLTVFPMVLAGTLSAGYSHVSRINRMLTEEIHERRRVQCQLEHLSRHDSLTGLGNRRTFDGLLDLEWRRALRAQLPLSLIMIDADGFKPFNDHYGHQAGDDALQRIATAISVAVKRAGDEVARYGGEEFVVVLPGADTEGAFHVGEDICRHVEAAGIVHARSKTGPYLTVSVGVASIVPSVDSHMRELIRHADQALYRAKNNGGNRAAT